MTTYFLFLRAINVGGHNMIKMKNLVLWMEQLGFSNVKTYLNSGNVIFKANTINQTHLAKQIRDKIFLESKLDISCLIRNLSELTEVNEKLKQQEVTKPESATLFVTFLSGKPTSENTVKLKSVNAGTDTFIVYDTKIVLACQQPYHKTKLSNSFFEKTLKLDATTRNRNTVEALLLLADNG
jgi:uncharacterized protein (DUF1697 family)